jgi:hypothetical protein
MQEVKKKLNNKRIYRVNLFITLIKKIANKDSFSILNTKNVAYFILLYIFNRILKRNPV